MTHWVKQGLNLLARYLTVVEDDVDGVHMHKGHLVRLLQGREVVCTSLRAGLKVGAEMAGAAAGAPLQFGSHPTSRRLRAIGGDVGEQPRV